MMSGSGKRWSVVVVSLGLAAGAAGCGNPVDKMCEARADYFDACKGTALDKGWNLIQDYGFYGVADRDAFVSQCSDEGQRHLDAAADDTERARLAEAYTDQAIQFRNYVDNSTCGPVP